MAADPLGIAVELDDVSVVEASREFSSALRHVIGRTAALKGRFRADSTALAALAVHFVVCEPERLRAQQLHQSKAAFARTAERWLTASADGQGEVTTTVVGDAAALRDFLRTFLTEFLVSGRP